MEFKDCRSGKVVFVPHCALNQNARLAGCSELPAAVDELVAGLMARQIGMIQLPCPELMVIALDRERIQIRSALESRPARAALRAMARDVVYQIREYLDAGVEVLGVLGKNGSPSCGVETTSRPQGPCEGMGAFIEELVAELAEQNVDVPVTGTLDAEPDAALAAVDAWRGRQAPDPTGGCP
jgi:predicted secreted protein